MSNKKKALTLASIMAASLLTTGCAINQFAFSYRSGGSRNRTASEYAEEYMLKELAKTDPRVLNYDSLSHGKTNKQIYIDYFKLDSSGKFKFIYRQW